MTLSDLANNPIICNEAIICLKKKVLSEQNEHYTSGISEAFVSQS